MFEYSTAPQPNHEINMEMFGMIGDFDINAAFQEAILGVASDAELALEEKVRRVEVIVAEGTSDVYRDFVDFRQLAAQMEMMCNHDNDFNQSLQGSESLSSFMNSFKTEDLLNKDKNNDDDEYEIDPKTGKKIKKKKRLSWFGVYR